MLLALVLSIFALCLYRIRFNLKGFNEDYLSRDCTNSIKGVFILLIVISHSIPYFKDCGYLFANPGDSLFLPFFFLLSQLVVVMFLFYSGYGVGESFKSKGDTYVKAMPRHRILGTLLNFDVAVLVFMVVDLLLGIELTANQCLLSLTAWKNIGNDNWYIFVILLCYLMTYIVLRLPISKSSHRVVLLFGLCVICMIVLSFYKGTYWFNTILCYPLGFMYSTYKESIEKCLKRSYWLCLLVVFAIFVPVFILLHNCPSDRFQIGYNLVSILFAMMLVILTLKVRICNQPLLWAGMHLFPIYIYMRLPMVVMKNKAPEFVGTYPALFILVSLVLTVLIARVYKHWEIKL